MLVLPLEGNAGFDAKIDEPDVTGVAPVADGAGAVAEEDSWDLIGAPNKVLVLPPAVNDGFEAKIDGADVAGVAVPSSGLLVRPNSEVPPGVDGAAMPEVAVPEQN